MNQREQKKKLNKTKNSKRPWKYQRISKLNKYHNKYIYEKKKTKKNKCCILHNKEIFREKNKTFYIFS